MSVNRKVTVPVGSSAMATGNVARRAPGQGGVLQHWPNDEMGGGPVLLENRNAVVYGGGGPIGGAVARAFAREGAKVFLAGRTLPRLEAVAGDIAAAGGAAETAEADPLDEHAVDEHAD